MNSYYPMSKLKQLQEWKGNWNMIKELEELRKRNEPMKVDSSKHYIGFGYFKCPKCGGLFIEDHDKYCSECGQKLDWSDEK